MCTDAQYSNNNRKKTTFFTVVHRSRPCTLGSARVKAINWTFFLLKFNYKPKFIIKFFAPKLIQFRLSNISVFEKNDC